MEIAFNINDNVKFRLTRRGREIFTVSDLAAAHQPDENGYLSMQLWEVMQIFGEACFVGADPVFVDNKIWL